MVIYGQNAFFFFFFAMQIAPRRKAARAVILCFSARFVGVASLLCSVSAVARELCPQRDNKPSDTRRLNAKVADVRRLPG